MSRRLTAIFLASFLILGVAAIAGATPIVTLTDTTEAALIDKVQRHAKEKHSKNLTPEQARGMFTVTGQPHTGRQLFRLLEVVADGLR